MLDSPHYFVGLRVIKVLVAPRGESLVAKILLRVFDTVLRLQYTSEDSHNIVLIPEKFLGIHCSEMNDPSRAYTCLNTIHNSCEPVLLKNPQIMQCSRKFAASIYYI
jgi:hypothetical protein